MRLRFVVVSVLAVLTFLVTIAAPTPDPADAGLPVSGPIAFTSWRDGRTLGDIYVMDPDGANETRLTTNPGSDVTPAFSPDGTRIAYASALGLEGEPDATRLDIWVMTFNGASGPG
jgi:Tol biopolymer transport system component